MEPQPSSSVFPLAIRARLSTEDSASDASSSLAGESDDSSGVDGVDEEGEDEEESYEATDDDIASLRRPSMPRARITGDDEDDDVLEELVFDEEEEDEEVNPKLEVENLESRSSLVGKGEDFGTGFFGNYDKDDNLGDESPIIASMEELPLQENEKGYIEKVDKISVSIDNTGSDEGRLEMDSSAVVFEKIGAVSYDDVKQSNDFTLELKDLVVESSTIDSEENNLPDDGESTQTSVMKVELRALRAEAEAGNLGISEAEDKPVEIVKIGAAGAVTSGQHWDEEVETKAAEAEFGVWEDMEVEALGVIDSKNDLAEEKTFEASEFEADYTDFSHRKSLEMASLSTSNAFELKPPVLCADNMESEKDKDLYEVANYVDSEKANDSTENLYNSKEKLDESRTVVKEVPISKNYNACEFSSENFSSFYPSKKEMESRFDSFHVAHDEGSGEEDELSMPEWPASVFILENSETVKHILEEMEEGSSSSRSGFESSRNYSHILDGQFFSNSDEELEFDEDDTAKELFDTSALAALLGAASGTSQDTYSIHSINHPAAFRSATSLVRSTHAPLHSGRIDASSDLEIAGEYGHDMNDEEKKLHLKLEQIRVKYLRLVQRLGYSADDALPNHIICKLGLADGVRGGIKVSEEYRFESAKKAALRLEEEGKDDFTFSCNILVLGKMGVGKSAAINSIFGEERASTDPFQPATTSVREISGVVDGVYIRAIDTPGLLTSLNDQGANRKILSSIKKYTRRCPPDVVLYVDRLDTYTRYFDDLPILQMITRILGSSIWFNSIIALTHATSTFPDGPDGSSLSYEVVVAQRSNVVQQSIRQAVGDIRLVNPVTLVENHPSCRRNMDGESILPNGLRWRPWLLLLCYSSKILSEVDSLMKLQIPLPQKLFPSPLPLPVFLSSLLQSKGHPKSSTNQGGDNYDSDTDLDMMTNEVLEEDDEYDQLPHFKPLMNFQVQKLTMEQKNAYFDEYNYRVKLLQKKQWKEGLRRLKKTEGESNIEEEQDVNPSAVPVPLPDMLLPPSFDCENPTYRYRILEPTSLLLTRPVLHSHSWDHDSGYDGVSIEENLHVASQFPMSLAVQITKDKKEFSIYLDSSIASKHEENGSTLATFNIQPVGKQLAYTLQGESKFKNLKKNTTAAGVLVTCLGETLVNGVKLEDQIFLGKKLRLVASTGVVQAQRDFAYGANLEVRFRERDYPIGGVVSILGLSVLKWRDFTVGANFQSEFSAGRNSKMAVCVALNNKNSWQISIKTSSTEHVHIALLGLFPLVLSICRSIWNRETN